MMEKITMSDVQPRFGRAFRTSLLADLRMLGGTLVAAGAVAWAVEPALAQQGTQVVQGEVSSIQPDAATASQNADDESNGQVHVAELPEMDEAQRKASIEAAMTQMREVAKAYREAPALTDVVVIRNPNLYGRITETPMTVKIADDKALLAFYGYRFTRIGDTVYGELDLVVDRYFEAPLNVDLATTLAAGDQGFILPHFLLRRAESPTDLRQAVTRFIDTGEITGSQEVEYQDKPMIGVYASGVDTERDMGGNMVMLIDPETDLIQAVRLDRYRELASGERVWSWAEFEMSPEVVDELDEPIAFEPGERTPVSQIGQLQARARGVGEPALPFEFTTIDGEQINVAEPKDSAKVLLFWHSAWPEESGKAVDVVKSLRTWTEAEGHPVSYYAINVLAMDPRSETHETQVKEFWAEKTPGFPVAIDYDVVTVANYGIVKTPVAIVVDPAGTISRVIVGYDDRWEPKIKAALGRALGIQTDEVDDTTTGSDTTPPPAEWEAEKAGNEGGGG